VSALSEHKRLALLQLLNSTKDFLNEYLVKAELTVNGTKEAALTVKTPKATYTLTADLVHNNAVLTRKFNGSEKRMYKGSLLEAVVHLLASVMDDISSVLTSAMLMTNMRELIASYPTDFACALLRATKRWYFSRALR